MTRIASVTIGLPVDNLEAAVDWYRQFLDLPEELSPAPGVHEFSICSSAWLQLFECETEGSGEAVPRLETNDIEMQHGIVRDMGVEPGAIELVPGAVRYFDFRDPFGNQLSFYELSADQADA